MLIVNAFFLESALTIVKKLGSLPLALDQAGAYICAIRISFSQYLPRFEARFKEIAAKRPPKGVWSYEETVFTTWEVSFRALRSPAQELLLLCAFFDNEDIWEGLLPQKELKEKFGIGNFLEPAPNDTWGPPNNAKPQTL